jgi:hypothetical protein
MLGYRLSIPSPRILAPLPHDKVEFRQNQRLLEIPVAAP